MATKPLSDSDLDALQALCNLAAEGPWMAVPLRMRMEPFAEKPIFEDGLWAIAYVNNPERMPVAMVDRANDHHAPTRKQAAYTAELIAHAREALPALLDEVKRMRAILKCKSERTEHWYGVADVCLNCGHERLAAPALPEGTK